ncbi:FmdB family zinc ribbon protein [Hyalangium gracile]|uniref:FmdB family zinc ribbon protein n=1 Tax=Hyalangium gracile TaxID=394092 RepID=UPI001CCE7236|nr:zinc ribbon domain-containing protein [Hyalangium gracile]
MPLYEYRCQGCSKKFEALVRGDDRARCPSCQGESLEKLFSVFAVNASGAEPAPKMAAGPCGSCGDPRGPGSCALN